MPLGNYPVPTESAGIVAQLPDLNASDSDVKDGLVKLLGRKGRPPFLILESMIRRFVATVDNLPRQHAPTRLWPVRAVAKSFVVRTSDTGTVIDQANFARYATYIDAMEAVYVPGLVDSYVHFYPLFQQAYRELGYPNGYFNNRLIEALDDMLGAPEPAQPVALVHPKVLYEFADPEFEELSAGRKIMIRIGSRNEARAKLVLRSIRAELMRGQGVR